jgi:hypothetical protein
MPCFQCLHLEDLKREADLKLLQSAPGNQEFLYWVIQSTQSRNAIEAHRRSCRLCEDPELPLASSF